MPEHLDVPVSAFQTQAGRTFLANTDRQAGLVGLIQGYVNSRLVITPNGEAHTVAGLPPAEANEIVLSTYRTLGFANQWHVVMLATFVETFLQDVLSACARVDPSIMRDPKPEATTE